MNAELSNWVFVCIAVIEWAIKHKRIKGTGRTVVKVVRVAKSRGYPGLAYNAAGAIAAWIGEVATDQSAWTANGIDAIDTLREIYEDCDREARTGLEGYVLDTIRYVDAAMDPDRGPDDEAIAVRVAQCLRTISAEGFSKSSKALEAIAAVTASLGTRMRAKRELEKSREAAAAAAAAAAAEAATAAAAANTAAAAMASGLGASSAPPVSVVWGDQIDLALVDALTASLATVAVNSPFEVLRAEASLGALLLEPRFISRADSSDIKLSILQFFRVVLAVHSPRTYDSGRTPAYPRLEQLVKVLHKELRDGVWLKNDHSRYSAEVFAELASDAFYMTLVAHQRPSGAAPGSAEAAAAAAAAAAATSAADFIWVSFLQGIKPSSGSVDRRIPWLQVLCRLLRKHRPDLGAFESRFPALISALHDVVAQQQHASLVAVGLASNWAMMCLCSLARAPAASGAAAAPEWAKVWTLLVKQAAVIHASKTRLSNICGLMAAMIEAGIVGEALWARDGEDVLKILDQIAAQRRNLYGAFLLTFAILRRHRIASFQARCKILECVMRSVSLAESNAMFSNLHDKDDNDGVFAPSRPADADLLAVLVTCLTQGGVPDGASWPDPDTIAIRELQTPELHSTTEGRIRVLADTIFALQSFSSGEGAGFAAQPADHPTNAAAAAAAVTNAAGDDAYALALSAQPPHSIHTDQVGGAGSGTGEVGIGESQSQPGAPGGPGSAAEQNELSDVDSSRLWHDAASFATSIAGDLRKLPRHPSTATKLASRMLLAGTMLHRMVMLRTNPTTDPSDSEAIVKAAHLCLSFDPDLLAALGARAGTTSVVADAASACFVRLMSGAPNRDWLAVMAAVASGGRARPAPIGVRWASAAGEGGPPESYGETLAPALPRIREMAHLTLADDVAGLGRWAHDLILALSNTEKAVAVDQESPAQAGSGDEDDHLDDGSDDAGYEAPAVASITTRGPVPMDVVFFDDEDDNTVVVNRTSTTTTAAAAAAAAAATAGKKAAAGKRKRDGDNDDDGDGKTKRNPNKRKRRKPFSVEDTLAASFAARREVLLSCISLLGTCASLFESRVDTFASLAQSLCKANHLDHAVRVGAAAWWVAVQPPERLDAPVQALLAVAKSKFTTSLLGDTVVRRVKIACLNRCAAALSKREGLRNKLAIAANRLETVSVAADEYGRSIIELNLDLAGLATGGLSKQGVAPAVREDLARALPALLLTATPLCSDRIVEVLAILAKDREASVRLEVIRVTVGAILAPECALSRDPAFRRGLIARFDVAGVAGMGDSLGAAAGARAAAASAAADAASAEVAVKKMSILATSLVALAWLPSRLHECLFEALRVLSHFTLGQVGANHLAGLHALGLLARSSGYSSPDALMREHLPRLLCAWMVREHPVAEFAGLIRGGAGWCPEDLRAVFPVLVYRCLDNQDAPAGLAERAGLRFASELEKEGNVVAMVAIMALMGADRKEPAESVRRFGYWLTQNCGGRVRMVMGDPANVALACRLVLEHLSTEDQPDPPLQPAAVVEGGVASILKNYGRGTTSVEELFLKNQRETALTGVLGHIRDLKPRSVMEKGRRFAILSLFLRHLGAAVRLPTLLPISIRLVIDAVLDDVIPRPSSISLLASLVFKIVYTSSSSSSSSSAEDAAAGADGGAGSQMPLGEESLPAGTESELPAEPRRGATRAVQPASNSSGAAGIRGIPSNLRRLSVDPGAKGLKPFVELIIQTLCNWGGDESTRRIFNILIRDDRVAELFLPELKRVPTLRGAHMVEYERTLTRLRGERKVEDEIRIFLDSPLVAELAESRLRHLASMLSQQKERLVDDFFGPRHEVTRKLLSDFLSNLFFFCTPQHPQPTRRAAGACLGKLGALDPFLFSTVSSNSAAFTVIQGGPGTKRTLERRASTKLGLALQDQQHQQQQQQHPGGRQLSAEDRAALAEKERFARPSTLMDTHLGPVMHELIAVLTQGHGRAEESAAAEAISAIMGAADYERQCSYILTEEQRLVIEPHLALLRQQQRRQGYAAPTAKEAAKAAELAVSERLSDGGVWRCPGPTMTKEEYCHWVKRLAAALCVDGALSPFLRIVAPVARVAASFAEFVFPIALLDVFCHRSKDTCTRLSRLFHQHIIGTAAGEDPRPTEPVAMVLRALTTLRTHQAVLNRHRLKHDAEWNVAGLGAFGSVFFSENLDYARAALRVSAPATALLHLEAYVEQEAAAAAAAAATGAAPQATSGAPGAMSRVTPLLLEVYRGMNDPDCIYGVASAHNDLSTAIAVCEHEGRWSSALGAYDAIARNSGGGRGDRGLLEAQLGLLRSLQMLGHRTLLQGLLQSLARSTGPAPASAATAASAASASGPASAVTGAAVVEIEEMRLEEAWRMRDWGADTAPGAPTGAESSFHGFVFRALKSCATFEERRGSSASAFGGPAGLLAAGLQLQQQQGEPATLIPDSVSAPLERARMLLVEEIGATSKESSLRAYPALAKLQLLSEIEDVAVVLAGSASVRLKAQRLSNLAVGWKRSLPLVQGKLEYLEPLLALRRVLLFIGREPQKADTQLLELARFARRGGNNEMAWSALREVKDSPDNRPQVLLQEAKLYHASGNIARAVDTLKRLRDILPPIVGGGGSAGAGPGGLPRTSRMSSESLLLNAMATGTAGSSGTSSDEEALCALNVKTHLLLGSWMASTRVDSSEALIAQYFDVAVQAAPASKKPKCHFTLALYAEEVLGTVFKRLSAPEFTSHLNEMVAERQALEAQIKERSAQPASVAAQARVREVSRAATVAIKARDSLAQEAMTLLETAVSGYVECLDAIGVDGGRDLFGLDVACRLLGLWFEYGGAGGATAAPAASRLASRVNAMVAGYIAQRRPPSRHFVPFLYQIFSRLGGPGSGAAGSGLRGSSVGGSSDPAFLGGVAALAAYILGDHPHHCVYQLIALERGVNKDKASAARALLEGAPGSHRATIELARQLVSAYVELSEFDPEKDVRVKSNKGAALTKGLARFKVPAGTSLVLPTAALPVDPSLTYAPATLPGVGEFDPGFTIPGGKSRPKLITCTLTTGVRHQHLVKGGEDMRQDAVMEQLFGLVNHLLRRDPETRRRTLAVRTYGVVPLSPTHGLIQFVENAIPLSKYLFADSNGAHQRYKPRGTLDWGEIQDRLREAYTAASKDPSRAREPAVIIEEMRDIFARFPPAMRHFFTESFPDPATWFERRVAYTRSVATSSIVGFIVGLGDRHSSNILIDLHTAEVIHIDLGIAFDAGKCLQTPERVPFRLTRDIVDGMGITKTEGVFRRCAEEALRCIRSAEHLLLTIAQVLVHDPLFSWTLTHQQQQPASNYNAEAVLRGLRDKLRGQVNGRTLSVPVHVEHLIQEATAIENLALHFYGWAPHC